MKKKVTKNKEKIKKKKIIKIVLLIVFVVVVVLGIILLLLKKNNGVTDNKFSDRVSYKEKVFKSKKIKPTMLEKISDGYLIASEINIVDNDDGYSSDIRISKYDFDFQEKWQYDYIGYKELERIGASKDERLYLFVADIQEKDDVYYIVIDINNDDDDYESVLLVFDRNGSLYNNKIFEDTSFDKIIDISKDRISFSEVNNFYEYNFGSDELSTKKPESVNNNEMRIIDKEDSLYYACSYVNYYMDEDDNNIVEGDNSFYILNDELKITKKISLDEAIGITIDDEHNVDYGTVRRIDDKFYLPYNTTVITDDAEDPDYYGLLIIDKDLNVIHNIKYDDPKIKNEIESIFDYYIRDGEILYVLSDYDFDHIMIEKFDTNYKLLSSNKIRIPEFDESEESYGYTEKKVINTDEKGFVFYQIFDDNNENFDRAKSYLRIYSIEY